MKIKNTVIAMASTCLIPASVVAAETDYSFYGSLRVMVEAAEHENGDNFKDALSRIGVKGSHDLGDGLSAFAKYELKVDVANAELGSETGNDARQAYVGLAGDFGSIQAGRYWSTFYNAIGYAPDQLWYNSAPVYYTLDGDFRIGKSVMYTSPDMNGLTLSGLYSDDKELGQFAGTYKASDSLTLGLGYIDDENESLGAAFYYSGDGFYVNGMYMDKDNIGSGIDLIGGVSSGKSLYTLGVSSFEDDATSGASDFDALILAYQYNLRPNVKLWVEAWKWDGVLYGTADSGSINFGMN